jgi:Txe/YoeB family toxin of Txe-Axe toxin-antitoxin module
MIDKKITAKKGLAKTLKYQITDPKKAKRVQAAINDLNTLPSSSLIRNDKVKKISNDIFSYKVDGTSRIVFGESVNKRVLLDFIDINNSKGTAGVTVKKVGVERSYIKGISETKVIGRGPRSKVTKRAGNNDVKRIER